MSEQQLSDGVIRNGTYFLTVTDKYKSSKVAGYRLSDWIIETLIDEAVEDLVFVDPNRGRYTISLDDWMEHRIWSDHDQWQHVPQSRMARG